MDLLKRRRFPVITAFAQEYRQRMQALNLPAGAELIPPEDFESTRYRMVLNFHSLADFEHQLDGLHAVARDVNFQSIIDKDVSASDALH